MTTRKHAQNIQSTEWRLPRYQYFVSQSLPRTLHTPQLSAGQMERKSAGAKTFKINHDCNGAACSLLDFQQESKKAKTLLCLRHLLPLSLVEISLLSWNLSVNVTRGSAHLSWSDFPLKVSIESFSVKYTDVYANVSVYRRLEHSHLRTYYLERGVRPDREFMFQIIATAKNATYSSVKVSKTTLEGGKS